jgi:hypothetical protein
LGNAGKGKGILAMSFGDGKDPFGETKGMEGFLGEFGLDGIFLLGFANVGEGKGLGSAPLGDDSRFFGNEYGITGFPAAIGFDGAIKGKEKTISPFIP